MNRHQRRGFSVNFRRSKIESVPRELAPKNVAKKTTGVRGICDWPGCSADWRFVTIAVVDGTRKPVARRCEEHRLGDLTKAS